MLVLVAIIGRVHSARKTHRLLATYILNKEVTVGTATIGHTGIQCVLWCAQKSSEQTYNFIIQGCANGEPLLFLGKSFLCQRSKMRDEITPISIALETIPIIMKIIREIILFIREFI